jgi:1,4-alpha-glucan branching enzyme
MSLKKQSDPKKHLCKVTFTLAEDIANSANRVNLAGDFNNWDVETIPMKKLKGGDYSVSINLEKGREYQFKYLVEGLGWLNEKEADKYVPNRFQTENSVVIV